MSNGKSILLLGKPGSSKTVLLTQLIAIAKKKNSKVGFWETPNLNDHLKSSLERIRNGNEPVSTSADSHYEINLPISFNGENHKVICPDYGGEQILEIVKSKEVNDQWLKQVKNSDHWILLIKPNLIAKDFDLTTKNPPEPPQERKPTAGHEPSDEALFIELMQILRYIKGLGKIDETPRIVVALTCWDELKTNNETPAQVFENSLPMFSQFLRSNWTEESVRIIGVSAQGLSLTQPENVQKFINEGHDKFAYVIPNGSTEKVSDLTYVLYEILR